MAFQFNPRVNTRPDHAVFVRSAWSGVFLSTFLAATALLASAEELPSTEPAAATVAEAVAVISALPPAPARSLPATAPRAQIEAASAANAAKRAATKPAKAPAARKPVALAATSGETMRQAAQRLKLPLPLPNARVVVWKSRRELEVWSGQIRVKTYRVALGAAPVGHKVQQGDGRTPEGEFFICTRNAETSSFHIFLGLSYPALPDARRGLEQRAISEREFQTIRSRLASRSAPLWRTRLGGWVGIHGGTGERFANKQSAERKSPDWTAGCIALTNTQIEEIYAATKLGTPVSVRR